MSYTPHTEAEIASMLAVIGVDSLDELFDPVPEAVRLEEPLRLPAPLDEFALVQHMKTLARANTSAEEMACFLGAGIYDHFTPSVVDAILSRGEFLTAYTPYQPELSQGMLQAMYEYQTLVCSLTGMDMANASMYDAATALAEAALMLVGVTGCRRVLVSQAIHPHYRQVVHTYLRAAEIAYEEVPLEDGVTAVSALRQLLSNPAACALIQNPNFLGNLEDLAAWQEACSRHGVKTAAVIDPVSLGVLKPPGEYGFDVVVGEGQSMGLPMGFGGPLLGFFAFRKEYFRRFPGRIVGRTHDAQGRRGFTMTLRTREQDIRREKATSNICTNEALLALGMAVYLCALGRSGLRRIAQVCLQKSHFAADQLTGIPGVWRAFSAPFFKEFVVRLHTRRPVHDVCRTLRERRILAGYPLGQAYPDLQDGLLVCVTEKRSREEIERYAAALGEIMEAGVG